MEKFKIKSNVILGNIYARNRYDDDLRYKAQKKRSKEKKAYYELVREVKPGGITEKLVKVDYPITADYVKSHASNVDYKGNIEANWNAPARGVNVGDSTQIQKLLSQDTEAARALIKRLQAGVAEAERIKQNKQSEVNNNAE